MKATTFANRSFYQTGIRLALAVSLGLVLSACNKGGQTTVPVSGAPASSQESTPETVVPVSPEVNQAASVEKATVRIESEGKYVEVEGSALHYGSGSGFFIDEYGMIVTNHHVVGGAGNIKVFVNEGSESREYTARRVGVAECSDLAVIQLVNSDNKTFTPLRWAVTEPDLQIDVEAVGYPTNQHGYYFETAGKITSFPKAKHTYWSSIESSFSHSAGISEGNSGGPLVIKDTDQVVGVNYAYNQDDHLYYAINAEVASKITKELALGRDVLSIGITSEVAFSGGEPTGIWVSSVAPGSIADRAGIEAGDTITALNQIPLYGDNPELGNSNRTMQHYCEILNYSNPQDPRQMIPFEVTKQLGKKCTGMLNGNMPLSCDATPAYEPIHHEVYGELSYIDKIMANGSYVDMHEYEAERDTVLTITVTSMEITPAVGVFNLGNGEGASLGFDSGNPASVNIQVKSGQVISILVSSMSAYNVGDYVMTITE